MNEMNENNGLGVNADMENTIESVNVNDNTSEKTVNAEQEHNDVSEMKTENQNTNNGYNVYSVGDNSVRNEPVTEQRTGNTNDPYYSAANQDNNGNAENGQTNMNGGSYQNRYYNDADRYNSAYVPPTGNFSSGGYYSQKGNGIPDNRYEYGNRYEQYKPKQKKKKNNGWIIAVAIIAAVIIAALSAVCGALYVRNNINNWLDNDASETVGSTQNNDLPLETEKVPSITDDNPITKEPSSAVIVKNNDSVTIKTISGNVGDENLTVPDVVSLVKDSVVEIFTEFLTYNLYVGNMVQEGAGSGVIFSRSDDGKTAYIVTNNHVISGAETIKVRLTNGNEYTATLIGTDSLSDVAVISIEPEENVVTATLGNSNGLVVGETVIAIGNPLGELGGTVTNGIISALAREITIDGAAMTLLQTNAAINPGNSGGGLFNMKGELVGIVNAKSVGSDVDNLGFAIPIDTAYKTVTELMQYGYVTGRVDAGLTLVDVTDTMTAWYYNVNQLGVYISASKYTDELKSGDRIVAVNDTDVSTSADVKSIISKCSVGDTITIRITRKNKQYEVKLTLHEYVPEGVAPKEGK